MKIRSGFVSNSSSTSFVCNICGDIQSGYDCDLSELEMAICSKGHIMCVYHLDADTQDTSNEVYYEEGDYSERELKTEHCPLCQLEIITNETARDYAEAKYGIDIKKLKEEISNNFNNLQEVIDYIRKSK